MTTFPWEVTAVFDPDGGGSDFAYTVGLADAGRPELHLWSRPSEGLDPGLDWALSAHDCMHLLNRFATALLAGEVAVGDTVTQPADGGAVSLTFRFDETVEPDVLDAWGVAEGARVIPLRWSLHR